MIYKSVLDLVGNTPVLELQNYQKEKQSKATLLAKLEYFNPTGSIKDRIAKNMLEDALNKGIINATTTIIEPTSGNTGIGLASMTSALNMPCIIVMPDSMSIERRKLIQAYGAKIELTPGAKGMQGAVDRASELHETIENSFVASQFTNPANPLAHIQTAKELLEQVGQFDVLVAGIGTGGTISGLSKELKKVLPNLEVIGVEPSTSPLLTTGKAGPHKIQGIGANFIPETLNLESYSRIETIEAIDAYQAVHDIANSEGVLVGISSGAALHVAMKLSQDDQYAGKKIVIIFPDGGDRYLSTDLF